MRYLPYALLGALAAGYVGMSMYHDEQRPPILEIYVFALGSGHATFIRTPDDQRILIGGGGNSEVIRHLTHILPFYSRYIDAVVIPADRPTDIVGLIDVVVRYDVGRIYAPAPLVVDAVVSSSPSEALVALYDAARSSGIDVVGLRAGDRIDWGEVFADVLFPEIGDRFEYSLASPPEIVMRVSYDDTSVVCAGKATPKVQRYLVSSPLSPQYESDALVVSHGASASTLVDGFMETVDPRYIVYSKDEPSSSAKKPVVDPLAGMLDEQRFNLHERGDVRIRSDGEELRVDAFLL